MPEARSKKVLKKTTAKTVVKKTTSKKIPKKQTTALKTAKAKPQALKKTAKLTQKTSTKAAEKPSKVRSAANKTTSKPTKKVAEKKVTNVVLPTRMSIRAREKALVLAAAFEKKIHRPAYALTMTLGALFVLFGSYSGFFYSETAVVCQDASCAGQTGLLQSAFDTQLSPEINLITVIPSQINSDEEILIDTTNTSRVTAELLFSGQSGTTEVMEVAVKSALNGRFRIIIPGSVLDPNQYTIRVKPYDSSGESHAYKTLGSFSVPVEKETSTQTSGSFSDTESAFDSTESSLSTTSTFSVSDTESSFEQPTSTTLDEAEVQASDPIDTDVQTAGSEVDESTNKITVSSKSVLSGRAPISIRSSKAQTLSVYIRRVQSMQEQLVGKVTGSNVTYYLSTRNFPNGAYELTVRSSSAFDETESNSLRIEIQNETEQIVSTETQTTSLINEERELLPISPVVPLQTTSVTPDTSTIQIDSDVYNSDTLQTEAFFVERSAISTIDQSMRQRALDKLGSDRELLERLYTRYSAAIQSGNPDMIREARNSISAYHRSVVDLALASPEDRFIADDLSKSLQEEIDMITARVDKFESLRRERSEGRASKDTDGDGITDTDERVLFGTDPLRADTDGDGFTDGAEIIKGFNPVDAASEAIIVYKSPKETIGISANENLQVIEVVPDVALPSSSEEQSTVQTRVRGKALPNSFVTLFVFSTPTIVTVRTEADGSFEYTFSKELEDGEHQVFVALTDNTGDIVAQSKPFTFIKQAEAFTAVDAEAVISSSNQPDSAISSTSSFQTVLSMSVLALGILLIMLGVGLRSNRPDQFQIEATA